MELTETTRTDRGRRAWTTRVGLFGAAVALTAAVVIPRIGDTAPPATRDAVAPSAPITLVQSETSLEASAKRQLMLQAIGRLRLDDATSVCLPCIEREQMLRAVARQASEGRTG